MFYTVSVKNYVPNNKIIKYCEFIDMKLVKL